MSLNIEYKTGKRKQLARPSARPSDSRMALGRAGRRRALGLSARDPGAVFGVGGTAQEAELKHKAS